MNPALVIFDCDGVLVDSEPLSTKVLVEILAELGVIMTPEEARDTFVGRSTKTNLATIERMLGRPLPDGFLVDIMQRVSVAFARELRAVPGIETALDAINVPICVASGSRPEVLQQVLSLTGLLDRFDGNIFSAEQVSHGKPAPDLFLHAAQVMQASPEQCAVVEDSIAGIQAGIAAGMKVLAYTGTFSHHILRDAGAHVVFESMTELPSVLARLN